MKITSRYVNRGRWADSLSAITLPGNKIRATTTVVIACVTVGLAATFLSTRYFTMMVPLIAAAFCLARWRKRASIILLLGAAYLDRLKINVVPGTAILPSHLATIAVLTSTLLWIAASRRRLYPSWIDYTIAAYILLNFISSAVNAPDPNESLRSAVSYSLMIVGFYLLEHAIDSDALMETAFRATLAVGAAGAGVGILAIILNHITGFAWGVNVNYYGNGYTAVYGTLFEPNLYGSYCASVAVGLLVASEQEPANRRRLYHLAAVVSGIGVFLSLSRAAIAALILLTASYFLIQLCRSRRVWLIAPPAVLATLTVALFASAYGDPLFNMHLAIVQRLNTIVGGAQALDPERLNAYANALRVIPEHLLIGWGTKSYGQLFDWISVSSQGWLGNMALRIMMDTGTVGVALVAVAVGDIIRGSLPLTDDSRATALRAMVVTLLLCFMTTDGSTLGFFWLLLAMLRSATLHPRSNSRLNGGLSTIHDNRRKVLPYANRL